MGPTLALLLLLLLLPPPPLLPPLGPHDAQAVALATSASNEGGGGGRRMLHVTRHFLQQSGVPWLPKIAHRCWGDPWWTVRGCGVTLTGRTGLGGGGGRPAGVLLIGLSRPPRVSTKFRSSGPAGVIGATATGDLQRGGGTPPVGGLREGSCRMDPQCPDHPNPPPMEKQKWWGQDSGLADLQEKIDTASCGEE